MDRLVLLKHKIIKNDWLLALSLVICFILAALFIGYYSNLVIPGNSDPLARYSLEPATHLDFMSEWDGPHYLTIAQHGYRGDSLTAFFPLYPLLIRIMMFVVRSPLISALLVSWAALVGAVYFYIRILRELISKNINDIILGLFLFLFFPTGIFLAATYTASLFAFLGLGALFYGLKGKLWPATIFTALATATHPEGIFLIPLVVLLLWEARLNIKKLLLSAILGLSGIVGYISYLWVTRGKPLDFVSAQRHSHWLSAHYFATISSSITAIDIVLFALVGVSVVYWWNKRKSLSVYSLLYFVLPLIGGNFAGYSRYTLMAFPLQFMLLDKYRRSKIAYPVIIVISTILWTYFVIHYAAGYTGG